MQEKLWWQIYNEAVENEDEFHERGGENPQS